MNSWKPARRTWLRGGSLRLHIAPTDADGGAGGVTLIIGLVGLIGCRVNRADRVLGYEKSCCLTLVYYTAPEIARLRTLKVMRDF